MLKRYELDNSVQIDFIRRTIQSDEAGYLELTRIGYLILSYRNTEIYINVEELQRFEPSMIAPLVILLRQTHAQGNKLYWRRLNPAVREIFALHNLVRPQPPRLPTRGHPLNRNNAQYGSRLVPTTMRGATLIHPSWASFGLKEFSGSQSEEFASFAKKSLEGNKMPKMTSDLKDKVYEGIDEIFSNSALHARSKVKHAASGFFDKDTGVLNFVFADGGRGIKGAYEAAYKEEIAADKAIDWAMTPGSTTRQGDIPGGLGLKILRKFVSTNKGSITVISNDGFWCEKDGQRVQMRMANIFPGTVISISINSSDDNSYDLDRSDTEDLW